MNELQVVVQQEPGVIKLNFEQLKAELEDRLKIYETMVYTDDSIAEAKKDVAALRKLKTALDAKRIDIKKKCLEPYDVVEGQVTELKAIIDKPINAVNERVKSYEDEQKRIRREEVMTYFDGALTAAGIEKNLAQIVKKMRYDVRWENKSVKPKKWKEAVDQIVDQTRTDVSLIGNMDEDFREPCMEVYKQTLALGKAVEKQAELQRQKEQLLEAERRRQEEARMREQREAERRAAMAAYQEKQKDAESAQEVTTPDKKSEPVVDRVYSRPMPEPDMEPVKPENTGKLLRIFCTEEQYRKIIGYINFVGASYTEA